MSKRRAYPQWRRRAISLTVACAVTLTTVPMRPLWAASTATLRQPATRGTAAETHLQTRWLEADEDPQASPPQDRAGATLGGDQDERRQPAVPARGSRLRFRVAEDVLAVMASRVEAVKAAMARRGEIYTEEHNPNTPTALQRLPQLGGDSAVYFSARRLGVDLPAAPSRVAGDPRAQKTGRNLLGRGLTIFHGQFRDQAATANEFAMAIGSSLGGANRILKELIELGLASRVQSGLANSYELDDRIRSAPQLRVDWIAGLPDMQHARLGDQRRAGVKIEIEEILAVTPDRVTMDARIERQHPELREQFWYAAMSRAADSQEVPFRWFMDAVPAVHLAVDEESSVAFDEAGTLTMTLSPEQVASLQGDPRDFLSGSPELRQRVLFAHMARDAQIEATRIPATVRLFAMVSGREGDEETGAIAQLVALNYHGRFDDTGHLEAYRSMVGWFQESGPLIDGAVDSLTAREAEVIRRRTGLETGSVQERAEVGRHFGVGPTNIRSVEVRALKKMRDPSRSRTLQPGLEAVSDAADFTKLYVNQFHRAVTGTGMEDVRLTWQVVEQLEQLIRAQADVEEAARQMSSLEGKRRVLQRFLDDELTQEWFPDVHADDLAEVRQTVQESLDNVRHLAQRVQVAIEAPDRGEPILAGIELDRLEGSLPPKELAQLNLIRIQAAEQRRITEDASGDEPTGDPQDPDRAGATLGGNQDERHQPAAPARVSRVRYRVAEDVEVVLARRVEAVKAEMASRGEVYTEDNSPNTPTALQRSVQAGGNPGLYSAARRLGVDLPAAPPRVAGDPRSQRTGTGLLGRGLAVLYGEFRDQAVTVDAFATANESQTTGVANRILTELVGLGVATRARSGRTYGYELVERIRNAPELRVEWIAGLPDMQHALLDDQQRAAVNRDIEEILALTADRVTTGSRTERRYPNLREQFWYAAMNQAADPQEVPFRWFMDAVPAVRLNVGEESRAAFNRAGTLTITLDPEQATSLQGDSRNFFSGSPELKQQILLARMARDARIEATRIPSTIRLFAMVFGGGEVDERIGAIAQLVALNYHGRFNETGHLEAYRALVDWFRESGPIIDGAVDSLTTREAGIVRRLSGLETGSVQPPVEVGRRYGVTRERIRQIRNKALRKLRHPARSRNFRPGLDALDSAAVIAGRYVNEVHRSATGTGLEDVRLTQQVVEQLEQLLRVRADAVRTERQISRLADRKIALQRILDNEMTQARFPDVDPEVLAEYRQPVQERLADVRQLEQRIQAAVEAADRGDVLTAEQELDRMNWQVSDPEDLVPLRRRVEGVEEQRRQLAQVQTNAEALVAEASSLEHKRTTLQGILDTELIQERWPVVGSEALASRRQAIEGLLRQVGELESRIHAAVEAVDRRAYPEAMRELAVLDERTDVDPGDLASLRRGLAVVLEQRERLAQARTTAEELLPQGVALGTKTLVLQGLLDTELIQERLPDVEPEVLAEARQAVEALIEQVRRLEQQIEAAAAAADRGDVATARVALHTLDARPDVHPQDLTPLRGKVEAAQEQRERLAQARTTAEELVMQGAGLGMKRVTLQALMDIELTQEQFPNVAAEVLAEHRQEVEALLDQVRQLEQQIEAAEAAADRGDVATAQGELESLDARPGVHSQDLVPLRSKVEAAQEQLERLARLRPVAAELVTREFGLEMKRLTLQGLLDIELTEERFPNVAPGVVAEHREIVEGSVRQVDELERTIHAAIEAAERDDVATAQQELAALEARPDVSTQDLAPLRLRIAASGPVADESPGDLQDPDRAGATLGGNQDERRQPAVPARGSRIRFVTAEDVEAAKTRRVEEVKAAMARRGEVYSEDDNPNTSTALQQPVQAGGDPGLYSAARRLGVELPAAPSRVAGDPRLQRTDANLLGRGLAVLYGEFREQAVTVDEFTMVIGSSRGGANRLLKGLIELGLASRVRPGRTYRYELDERIRSAPPLSVDWIASLPDMQHALLDDRQRAAVNRDIEEILALTADRVSMDSRAERRYPDLREQFWYAAMSRAADSQEVPFRWFMDAVPAVRLNAGKESRAAFNGAGMLTITLDPEQVASLQDDPRNFLSSSRELKQRILLARMARDARIEATRIPATVRLFAMVFGREGHVTTDALAQLVALNYHGRFNETGHLEAYRSMVDSLRESSPIIDRVVDSLADREPGVIRRRTGLETGRIQNVEEVRRHFGVTQERIRQIERKALAKLRHPSRSRTLRPGLEVLGRASEFARLYVNAVHRSGTGMEDVRLTRQVVEQLEQLLRVRADAAQAARQRSSLEDRGIALLRFLDDELTQERFPDVAADDLAEYRQPVQKSLDVVRRLEQRVQEAIEAADRGETIVAGIALDRLEGSLPPQEFAQLLLRIQAAGLEEDEPTGDSQDPDRAGATLGGMAIDDAGPDVRISIPPILQEAMGRLREIVRQHPNIEMRGQLLTAIERLPRDYPGLTRRERQERLRALRSLVSTMFTREVIARFTGSDLAMAHLIWQLLDNIANVQHLLEPQREPTLVVPWEQVTETITEDGGLTQYDFLSSSKEQPMIFSIQRLPALLKPIRQRLAPEEYELAARLITAMHVALQLVKVQTPDLIPPLDESVDRDVVWREIYSLHWSLAKRYGLVASIDEGIEDRDRAGATLVAAATATSVTVDQVMQADAMSVLLDGVDHTPTQLVNEQIQAHALLAIQN